MLNDNGQLKVGKFLSTAVIVILFVVGLIIIFLPNPIDRIEAYKIFVQSIWPIVLTLTGGVAITGIVKQVGENKKDTGSNGAKGGD